MNCWLWMGKCWLGLTWSTAWINFNLKLAKYFLVVLMTISGYEMMKTVKKCFLCVQKENISLNKIRLFLQWTWLKMLLELRNMSFIFSNLELFQIPSCVWSLLLPHIRLKWKSSPSWINVSNEKTEHCRGT